MVECICVESIFRRLRERAFRVQEEFPKPIWIRCVPGESAPDANDGNGHNWTVLFAWHGGFVLEEWCRCLRFSGISSKIPTYYSYRRDGRYSISKFSAEVIFISFHVH